MIDDAYAIGIPVVHRAYILARTVNIPTEEFDSAASEDASSIALCKQLFTIVTTHKLHNA